MKGPTPASGLRAASALLVPEPLTRDAFAPFGEVLDVPTGRKPGLVGELSRGWAMSFESEGTAQVLVLETSQGSPVVERLERHDAVTQTFVAMDGAASILVVGPGSPSPGRRPPPELDEMKAFIVRRGQGFLLWRGTWHAPDRHALGAEGTAFAVFTDEETTASAWDGDSFVGTQTVSCEELWGEPLRLSAPR